MNDYHVGDKVKIGKIRAFWFIDMVDNAKRLNKDKVYTISTVEVASSWTGITLKETGDIKYIAHHFQIVK
jgi:hypothetical protein